MAVPTAHVALLVDFANLRLGLAEQHGHSDAEGSDPVPELGARNGAADSPVPQGDEGPRPIPATRDIARALVSYAESLGRVGLSRAYADWSRIPQTARQLGGTRISPVLVPATADGEDRSHIQLAVDAVECLFNGDEPDAFVLVSGDPTLVPLVQTIRADGSEVIVVAADGPTSEELRNEADRFVDLGAVFGGATGDAVMPRAWRTEQPSRTTGESAKPQPKAGGREPTYTGPQVSGPEFGDYDWAPFIRLIEELENRLPFVGVRYLVNKVLAPHNCGIDDPRIKRDLINAAVDDGVIEMYTVGNVDNRTDPVTACRLDRENELVLEILGATEGAEPDVDELAFAPEFPEEVAAAAE